MEVEVKFVYKRVKKLDDCKSILNNIFKRIMYELKLVKFGRSDFNPEMAYKIPQYKLVQCIFLLQILPYYCFYSCKKQCECTNKYCTFWTIYQSKKLEKNEVQTNNLEEFKSCIYGFQMNHLHF